MLVSKFKLKKVALKYGLDLVVLFGSQATSLLKEKSDLDIAVRTTRFLDSKEELSLLKELSLIFPQEIDLSFINEADSVLIYELARDGIPLYEKTPDTFIEFQLYATKRWEDDTKYRELTKKYVLKGKV